MWIFRVKGATRDIRNDEVFISEVIVNIAKEVEERCLDGLWIPFWVIVSGVPFIADICVP